MTRNTSYPLGIAQQLLGGSTKNENPAPNEHTQLTVAKTRLQRQLTDLLIDNKDLVHSKWLPGSTHVIPNILSRD